MNGILIVSEHQEGNFNKVTEQLIGKARELANELSQELSLVILGYEIEGLLEKIKGRGINKCYLISHKHLGTYNTEIYKKVLADLIKEINPTIVLGGSTFTTNDLFASLAARLPANFLPDVNKITIDGKKIIVERPINGGRILDAIEVQKGLITIPVNVFKEIQYNDSRQTEIIKKEVEIQENARKKFIETVKIGGKTDLTAADLIAAGGLGIKTSKKSFRDLELLAEILEKITGLPTAVGASRAAVNLLGQPQYRQVGRTGKEVRPLLYLAFGISGQQQHREGLWGAKFIIAVNKDPEAPIFKFADFGIVDDLSPILEELIKALQAQVQAKK